MREGHLLLVLYFISIFLKLIEIPEDVSLLDKILTLNDAMNIQKEIIE